MPKRELSPGPGRRPKKKDPEQLWSVLCSMYPQHMAAELFKDLMGYAPPQEWRKPEPLTITISEEE